MHQTNDSALIISAFKKADKKLPSDSDLFQWTFEQTAKPLATGRNSFLLHAALEICARAHIWRKLHDKNRNAARLQVFATGKQYETSAQSNGDETKTRATPEAAKTALSRAIETRDEEMAAAAIKDLVGALSKEHLAPVLIDVMLQSTAGAGHLHILIAYILDLPPPFDDYAIRTAPALGDAFGAPYNINFDDFVGGDIKSTLTPIEAVASLTNKILATPILGNTDVLFVNAITKQALDAGFLEQWAPLIGVIAQDPQSAAEIFRTINRAAAWSMLTEPDTHAKYGWSHCLSLPLAAARVFDVSPDKARALTAAAIYYAAFRAAHATKPMDADALNAWLNDQSAAFEDEWNTLANEALIRTDAHLVKYVSTSLWASEMDPAGAPLYQAAARKLADIWIREIPSDAIDGSLVVGRSI